MRNEPHIPKASLPAQITEQLNNNPIQKIQAKGGLIGQLRRVDTDTQLLPNEAIEQPNRISTQVKMQNKSIAKQGEADKQQLLNEFNIAKQQSVGVRPIREAAKNSVKIEEDSKVTVHNK